MTDFWTVFWIFERVPFNLWQKWKQHLVRQCLFDIRAKFLRLWWLLSCSKKLKTSKNCPFLAQKTVFWKFDRVPFNFETWNLAKSIQRSKIRHLGWVWWLWRCLQDFPVTASTIQAHGLAAELPIYQAN